MPKILITGSTGLIGKELLKCIDGMPIEFLAPTSQEFNLFNVNQMDEYLSCMKPEYLIHLAWITGGDYLSNPINETWAQNSFHLLESFQKYGGQRAVFAGTCFEYDFQDCVLSETTRLKPNTEYAKQKVNLYESAMQFADKENLSFAWGRIFYAFGSNEKNGRLTPSVINKLLSNEEVVIRYGQLVRDYIYSKDIAQAFWQLFLSECEGAVNICTGKGISLGDYARIIASQLGKEEFLKIESNETEQPLKIIGNPNRLITEVGFVPKYDTYSAIKDILINVGR